MTGLVAAVVALLVTVAVAGTDAWRTAVAHGWLDDGYHRLVRDAFWHRFDRTAPIALGALVVLALLSAAFRRALPTRQTLARPALLVAATLLARAAAFAYDGLPPYRPNVVLVSIDTLRADRLGTYGSKRPTSPVLDRRLAAEGVVFEQAFSHSPKTTPSHMTMLTSLYESVHGVGLWAREAAPVLNPRVHTLAEILKNAGYATAAFTAGAHMHRERGFVQGFDAYKHGEQLHRALTFLDAHQRRPFFLFFHTYEVHDPYVPPAAVADSLAADPVPAISEAVARIRAGVSGWGKAHKVFWGAVDAGDPRAVRYVSDLYDAGIAQMDGTTLPALLDRLDALGLADDTLVIFTSDHGEAFQEHGRFLHDDLAPETLHVPLVVRLPGRLPAGRRVREPVGLVDLLPTVLDLLSLPVPAQAQGRSLVALATAAGAAAPAVVVGEYPNPPGRRDESARTASLTLVREGGALALFDRVADPGEHHALGSDAAA
ncbi:MAG: sulfatase, partial [Candidatus Binatia bacterium]